MGTKIGDWRHKRRRSLKANQCHKSISLEKGTGIKIVNNKNIDPRTSPKEANTEKKMAMMASTTTSTTTKTTATTMTSQITGPPYRRPLPPTKETCLALQENFYNASHSYGNNDNDDVNHDDDDDGFAVVTAGIVLHAPASRMANQHVWKQLPPSKSSDRGNNNNGNNDNNEKISTVDHRYGIVLRYNNDFIRLDEGKANKLLPASFLHASMRAANPMYRRVERTGYFGVGLVYHSNKLKSNYLSKPTTKPTTLPTKRTGLLRNSLLQKALKRNSNDDEAREENLVDIVLCHATDAGSNARYGLLDEYDTTHVTNSSQLFALPYNPHRRHNPNSNMVKKGDTAHERVRVLATTHGKGCRSPHAHKAMCMDVEEEKEEFNHNNTTGNMKPTRRVCLMDPSCRCEESTSWGEIIIETESKRNRRDITYADFTKYFIHQKNNIYNPYPGSFQALTGLVFNSCWYEPYRMDEVIASANSMWMERSNWYQFAKSQLDDDQYLGYNECYVTGTNSQTTENSVDSYVIQLPPFPLAPTSTSSSTTRHMSSMNTIPHELICQLQHDTLMVQELASYMEAFGSKPVIFLVQTLGMIDENDYDDDFATKENNRNTTDTDNEWSFDHVIQDILHDRQVQYDAQQRTEKRTTNVFGDDYKSKNNHDESSSTTASSSPSSSTPSLCDEYWDGKNCQNGYSKFFLSMTFYFHDGSCLAQSPHDDCHDVYYFPSSTNTTTTTTNNTTNTTNNTTIKAPCQPYITEHCQKQINMKQKQRREKQQPQEQVTSTTSVTSSSLRATIQLDNIIISNDNNQAAADASTTSSSPTTLHTTTTTTTTTRATAKVTSSTTTTLTSSAAAGSASSNTLQQQERQMNDYDNYYKKFTVAHILYGDNNMEVPDYYYTSAFALQSVLSLIGLFVLLFSFAKKRLFGTGSTDTATFHQKKRKMTNKTRRKSERRMSW